ncbi:hypothetical protein [Butyrivibrio sp. XPD2006]|uniref:hypothetical protein n=1 Tax=Butyrivibrio sp. XPD2006 TaxID=1280668 RepID=UPI0003B78DEE|nr:hypothetical protein [Butyrivibrio sp. XPD2006]
MKKKSIYALLLITMTMLAGCGKQEKESTDIFEAVSNETPVTETTPVTEAESAAEEEPSKEAEEPSTEETNSGMKDGERFDSIIILEGMEETVHYEHIVNDVIGFEMDYDYESFVRKSDADRECFISVYDDVNSPENYLEVTRSSDDAETVAGALEKELSEEYDVTRYEMQLDNVGNCIEITASEDKNTHGTADMMQFAYIIPRDDGCLIARTHMYFEASEGFGRRFNYMLNTIR